MESPRGYKPACREQAERGKTMRTESKAEGQRRTALPSVEKVRQELGRAESIDDFFGKEGIFAKLFAETLEQMLEAELTDQLGYEKYEAKGRNWQQPQWENQAKPAHVERGPGD